MIWLLAILAATRFESATASTPVRIGSKTFTESVILGDLAEQIIRNAGIPCVHRRELGGTQILFHAVESGEIDIYPEYTGTLIAEILAGGTIKDDAALRSVLGERGIGMSGSLGFNNTYAIGLRADSADRLGLKTISDLKRRPDLRFGFSNEFMERADGWPGLRNRYDLPQRNVRGLDHDLAYKALAEGDLDAIDLYSTDPEIAAKNLRVLRDDLAYFPSYEAVWIYRLDLKSRAPKALQALARLEGRIDAASMARMNARAKIDRLDEERVAADFLRTRFDISAPIGREGFFRRLFRRLWEHLSLVATSLVAAIAAAIPLGILAARRPKLGHLILTSAGIIQTIPSLALLVFMIPWLGIGAKPALAALFLYSLLPIVRNTTGGLLDIPPSLRESAEALGLPRSARLMRIELPMASRAILSGIKTAAVINVGTATIGALIGAGGFGQPILTGIRRDDLGMILWEGALPAAGLALGVQTVFDLLESVLVPRGLKIVTR